MIRIKSKVILLTTQGRILLWDLWHLVDVCFHSKNERYQNLSSVRDYIEHNNNNNSNNNNSYSDIYLSLSPSWTNLKPYNIPITLRLYKKVITRVDLWKTSGLYCIPVVILKNCESKLLYILPGDFNICLKESCFFRLLKGLICGSCI